MPRYDLYERHHVTIQAPAERVRDALNHVAFADIGVMQTLVRIRAIAMGAAARQGAARGAGPSLPIVEMIQNPRSGFFPLGDTPLELVFGLAGQPWNNRGVRLTPGEFRAQAAPNNVKIAASFLIEDAGDGRCRVIRETRIAANDESACRRITK